MLDPWTLASQTGSKPEGKGLLGMTLDREMRTTDFTDFTDV
jgi:hypothetical protein